MSRILPKNLVATSHCLLPVLRQSVSMRATSGDSPMVSGTRMKW